MSIVGESKQAVGKSMRVELYTFTGGNKPDKPVWQSVYLIIGGRFTLVFSRGGVG